jgi:glycine cleavage system regulatory protein
MESIADLYVAGGLGADERREADQHAAACAECAAILRDAKKFSAWARGAIAPDAPPGDLEDRLIARFRAAGQAKKRRFPVGKRILKVTASIAAAVGLIFLGNIFSPQLAQTMNGDDIDGNVHVNGDELARYARIEGKTFDGRPRNEWFYFFGRDLGEEGQVALGTDKKNKAVEVEGIGGVESRTILALQDGKGKDDKSGGVGGGGGGRYGGRFGGKEAQQTDRLAEVDAAKLGALKQQGPTGGATFGVDEQANGQGALQRAFTGRGNVPSSPPPVQETRKIIRTADVALEVESYEATYTKLNDLVSAEKGQISSASTQKLANGKIRATVILRILPERFEAVLARLKEFGTIQNQTIGSQDVTKAYIDLETRLKSKEILAERLRKLLAEAKGNVKELMEVEVQLGATNEAIEQLKGEIKYYDNQIGMSTITLRISEKDLGQPFEYVQTLQSNIQVVSKDPDDVYVKAQKEITDAGGQVVDSKMARNNDGTSLGTIRGRVDSEKFPALREALKKLGVVTHDTVNQQKSARGGSEATPKADAPLRKEQAVVDFSVSSPGAFVTRRSQILVETPEVESAYQNSRRAVEAAGGKIVDGTLTGRADGMSATLKVEIDSDKFGTLVESLKTAGKVKNSNVQYNLPAGSSGGPSPLLRERAEIELALVTPPQLLGEQHGILKTIRDTFANSWAGLLWSIEKLFVGVSLAGPWIAVLVAAWVLWRRARRKKAAPTAP